MKLVRKSLAIAIWLWSGTLWSADWIELHGDERETLYDVVLAAQETHWTNSSRGWCRAHIDTRSMDGRILEIELCWSDVRTGIQIRNATQHVLEGKPKGDIEVLYTYGPKEYWYYHPHHAVNSLTGNGGKELRLIDPQMECRPHCMWLSILQGHAPEWTHRNLIKKHAVCKLFQSSDENRVRIQNGAMVFEFDRESEYSPVLFETNMNVKGVPKGGKDPIRETYDVAQDAHGVWYCKSMVRKRWEEGLDKDPITRHVATIVEYDSDPPPERMRLDYKSIGARSDAQVFSYIPGRSGSWKYGKGAADEVSGEEDALRKSSQKLRERGFAKEPAVQP